MSTPVWQLCPKCNGNKTQWDLRSTGIQYCNVCNGHGVISIFNGLPPYGYPTTITITTDTTDSKLNQTPTP